MTDSTEQRLDNELLTKVCKIFNVFPEELEYNLPDGIGTDKANQVVDLIKRYGLEQRRVGDEEGYHRGVDDFSNWFMDASILATRHQIGVDIARDLHKNYKSPTYMPPIELNQLTNKEEK